LLAHKDADSTALSRRIVKIQQQNFYLVVVGVVE
jgi:hypothetical protein